MKTIMLIPTQKKSNRNIVNMPETEDNKIKNATKRKCSATDKQLKRKKSNESATDSDV